MKKTMILLLASLSITAPLCAGGEKEKPFSLKEFVNKNAAHKRAYEKKQEISFQEKVTLKNNFLKNNETTKAIVKRFHEKHGHEVAELLQKHNDITQKMNRPQTPEEGVALFLAGISSQNYHQTKKAASTHRKKEQEEPTFISIPQPEGVPAKYNSAQPDDFRFLYCLDEVCLTETPQ